MDFEITQLINEYSGAVTVCDKQGIILYLNDKAKETFEKYGGQSLIGTNLLDCHPEPSRSKLNEMLKRGIPNVYTIEKNGIRKIIHQTPWFRNGKYSGFLELSLEIPVVIPNFMRN